jgi:hypothetical protein
MQSESTRRDARVVRARCCFAWAAALPVRREILRGRCRRLEVVREYVDVWNAGDMEGARELYDPDAVMEVAADWPEPGPFVGRDAVMHQLS